MPFSSDSLLSLGLRVQRGGYVTYLFIHWRKKNLFSHTLPKKDMIVPVPSNNNKNNIKLQLHFSWKCLYFVVPGRW